MTTFGAENNFLDNNLQLYLNKPFSDYTSTFWIKNDELPNKR